MQNDTESYKYLFSVLASTLGHLYWKNTEEIFLGCNDAQAKFLGYKSGKEIIGKTDFDLFPMEQAETLRKINESVIKTKKEYCVEETVNDYLGRETVFFSRKLPLYDSNTKRVIGIIGTSLDITKLKKTQAALQIALEKAKVSNQAKTEFLENMRHDIRTALSGIVGCAQLIRMQANNPKKVAEYADDLCQSSDALLEFLNKILESIQVASGEIPLLKKRFDLHRVLEQVVQLNKPEAHIKHLKLQLEYDRNIPDYLLGDPVRIQRIILEL